MENITIIQTKDFQQSQERIQERLNTIEHLLLEMVKQNRLLLNPTESKSDLPDFIACEDAVIKYKVSEQTIYKKLRLYKAVYGRPIDRQKSGEFKLINEAELRQALALKGDYKRPKK